VKLPAVLVSAVLLVSGCADTNLPVGENETSGSTDDASGPAELYQTPLDSLEILDEYPAPGMACMNNFFDSTIDVFGVMVIGASAPEEKLMHTAGVLAQYLDNDNDGFPDDPDVAEYLANGNFVFPVWTEEVREEFWSTSCGIDKISMVASMYLGPDGDRWALGGSSQTKSWDTNLEEVWHLVSVGFYNVYPEVFGDENSELTRAMDEARGGYFNEVPEQYPVEAWFSYYDPAPYAVHVHEYFYWAVVTNFGALSPEVIPGRCEESKHEWKICSKEELEKKDSTVFDLLNRRGFSIPSVIPDGIYSPETEPQMS